MKDRLAEIIGASGHSPEAFGRLSDGERRQIVADAGTFPADCSPIPVAPARGAMRAFTPMAAYPKGESGYEFKPGGYSGRRALQALDVFDVMAAQAGRAKRAAPFTPTQIAMARTYRGLVERHAAAGMKCASLETRGIASGGGGDFMEAVLRDREAIDAIRRRIGSGISLEVRRVRPSARGGQRIAITDRRLVDLVCLDDLTLDAVLKASGWSTKKDHREPLRRALAAALDRMTGPQRHDIRVMRLYDDDDMIPVRANGVDS